MSDYSKKTEEALKSEIAAKREELRTFRFAAAGSRSRNVREGRTLRKEIARMETELSARKNAEKKDIAKSVKTA